MGEIREIMQGKRAIDDLLGTIRSECNRLDRMINQRDMLLATIVANLRRDDCPKEAVLDWWDKEGKPHLDKVDER